MAEVLYSEINSVAYIRLNRPKKNNALNSTAIESISKHMQSIEKNVNIRVIVFQASGDNFCAGADLNWLLSAKQLSYQENIDDAKKLADMYECIYNSRCITIAVTQGKVIGGGVGLVSCCDIVLSNPHTSFSCPEALLGMVPAVIAPFLEKKIGISRTRYLVLSCQEINAYHAENYGLVNKIVPQNLIEKEVEDLVDHLLKTCPRAVIIMKNTLKLCGSNNDVDDNLTYEVMAKVRVSEDARKRIEKFLAGKK
ncbi:MAG: enoyl-CoA hydratase/isomerase family protein [Pseudomonadota bacterium]|nr:enoyl-CoA hydratase/isomerase family protein [Pseudomonadota bacterium]